MYAARDYNGDLHLFDWIPYLHIGAHNRVECGQEEIYINTSWAYV